METVKGSREIKRARQAKCPEMEVQLHREFKETQRLGRSINRKWSERAERRIFAELNSDQIGFESCNSHVVFQCAFLEIWFFSFKKRGFIS